MAYPKNKTLLETANKLFTNTKINITTEDKRHFEAAIGSNEFRVKYVTEKVNEWIDELRTLLPIQNRNRKLHMLLFVLESRISTTIFFVQYLVWTNL